MLGRRTDSAGLGQGPVRSCDHGNERSGSIIRSEPERKILASCYRTKLSLRLIKYYAIRI
jgi:hypothetical protein